jgi:acetyl-CoA C-acetyltransferase
MAFTSRLSKVAGKNLRFFSSRKFNDVVIVAATRTPIGSFQSSLSGLSASQLGGIAVESAVQQAGIAKENVDEVIMGNVVSAGLGKNLREVKLKKKKKISRPTSS